MKYIGYIWFIKKLNCIIKPYAVRDVSEAHPEPRYQGCTSFVPIVRHALRNMSNNIN